MLVVLPRKCIVDCLSRESVSVLHFACAISWSVRTGLGRLVINKNPGGPDSSYVHQCRARLCHTLTSCRISEFTDKSQCWFLLPNLFACYRMIGVMYVLYDIVVSFKVAYGNTKKKMKNIVTLAPKPPSWCSAKKNPLHYVMGVWVATHPYNLHNYKSRAPYFLGRGQN